MTLKWLVKDCKRNPSMIGKHGYPAVRVLYLSLVLSLQETGKSNPVLVCSMSSSVFTWNLTI